MPLTMINSLQKLTIRIPGWSHFTLAHRPALQVKKGDLLSLFTCIEYHKYKKTQYYK